MNWQDWLQIAGALFGIPAGGLTAIRLWKYFFGTQEADTVLLQLALPVSNEDRQLLKFDQAKVETHGTFECTIQSFATDYPFPEYQRNLIYDPQATKTYDALMQRMFASYAIMGASGALVLAITGALAFTFGNLKEWWEFIFPVALNSTVVVTLAVWAFFSYRRTMRHRGARQVAERYLEYLRLNDIRIRREFTQSKWMYNNPLRTQGSAAPVQERP